MMPAFFGVKKLAKEPQNDFGYGEQFEPDLFWENHGQKILLGALAVIVIGVALYMLQARARSVEEESLARLYRSATPSEIEAVAQAYAGKPVAAIALLRLAERQFDANQFDEASKAYEQFIQKFPSHPAVASARLGLIAVQEAKHQYTEARRMYEDFAKRYPTHPLTVTALLGIARCADAMGQVDEAIQLYEEAKAAITGENPHRSIWWEQANNRIQWLSRNRPKSTNASSQ